MLWNEIEYWIEDVAFVMGIDVIPQLRTNLVFFNNIESYDDITNCTRHSLSSVSHIFNFYITFKLENFKIIWFLIEFHYNLPNWMFSSVQRLLNFSSDSSWLSFFLLPESSTSSHDLFYSCICVESEFTNWEKTCFCNTGELDNYMLGELFRVLHKLRNIELFMFMFCMFSV